MAFDFSVKPTGYYAQIRTEMIKYIPVDAKRMLEIGCAEGNFGAFFKEKGLEVWGIEYSESEAKVAATKLDKVFTGDIALHIDSLPDGFFDVIVCNDVLEHLVDPYIILEKFKSKLSPGGVVVSSIPNIRYFRTLYRFIFKRSWEYTDNGIMDKTHFRFFTINSIRNMYENLGYEVISHEGINGSPSLKAVFWNVISLGLFSDIKYLQFATVSRVKVPVVIN